MTDALTEQAIGRAVASAVLHVLREQLLSDWPQLLRSGAAFERVLGYDRSIDLHRRIAQRLEVELDREGISQ